MSTLQQATATKQIVSGQKRVRTISANFWFLGAIMAVLVIGSIAMLFPFAWMVVSSLKSQEKVFVFPPEWIPNPTVWHNYVEALIYKPFYLYIFNTLIIVALNEVAILLSSSF